MSWIPLQRRREVFDRYRGECAYCHAAPAVEIDHVRPRADGGTDDVWNLVASCRYCNRRKGAYIEPWLPAWERKVFDQLAAEEEAERLYQEIESESWDVE